MDKRSSIGLIVLLVLLFGVNALFHWKQNREMASWRQQRNEWILQRAESLADTIEEEHAITKTLPLITLSSSQKEDEPVVRAIASGKYAFTFPWQKSWPSPLYADGKEYKELPLTDTPIALFRTDESAPLPGLSLSPLGSFSLALVEFSRDPETPPRVFAARYVDGNLHILSVERNSLLDELPEEQRPAYSDVPTMAIALFQTKEGYLPIGLYTNTTGTIEEWRSWPALAQLSASTQDEAARRPPSTEEEEYYVLENSYLQLVFSTRGGALAEINLPFQTETNPKSVVKPIHVDREILDNHPANAHFPLHPYFTANDSGKPTFHEETFLGGYYPLLRRDLIGKKPQRSYQVSPEYYATNVISDYPEVARAIYTVKEFSKNRIVLESEQTYRRIRKTYTLADPPTPYLFTLAIEIEGNARGLWITSGVPEVEIISNAPAPSLKYRITRQKSKGEVISITIPKETTSLSSIYPDWLSNSNGFFGVISNPLSKIDPGLRVSRVSGELVPSRLILVEDGQRFTPEKLPGFASYLPLSEKGGEMVFHFFTGPYDSRILKQVDRILTDPNTQENPDFAAAQTFHGWFAFISRPFAKFLFLLMNIFHQWTGSWGFSIILLTIALRIMLFPLNAWSSRSMMKMQEIAPKIQAIQEKNKKDPKKVQLETIALYREAGVNPLSGCFPILIQMPFLIGMFDLLKSSFALRGAGFIPGWIDNLAAPDVLFRWSTPIPFFGTEFHLLPILLGMTFFLQSKLFSSAPKNVAQMTDQQRQQQVMGTFTAVLFTFIFYNFPSGLNIYFISSTLLGMLQQWWTKRRMMHKLALKHETGSSKKGK